MHHARGRSIMTPVSPGGLTRTVRPVAWDVCFFGGGLVD